MSFNLSKPVVQPIQQTNRIAPNEKGSPPLPYPEQSIPIFNSNRNKEVLGRREVNVSVFLGKLRQIGVKDVSKGTIERLTSRYGTNKIQKSIQMTKWWGENRESSNLGGYFVASIRNNYKTKEIEMLEIEEDRKKRLNLEIEERREKRLKWETEKIEAEKVKKVIDQMKPFERQRLEKQGKTQFIQRKGSKPVDPIKLQLYEIDERCFIRSFVVKKVKERGLIGL